VCFEVYLAATAHPGEVAARAPQLVPEVTPCIAAPAPGSTQPAPEIVARITSCLRGEQQGDAGPK
jgi:hypothetical protein